MNIEARTQAQKAADALADMNSQDYAVWKVGEEDRYAILPDNQEGPKNGRLVYLATWGWRITDYLR